MNTILDDDNTKVYKEPLEYPPGCRSYLFESDYKFYIITEEYLKENDRSIFDYDNIKAEDLESEGFFTAATNSTNTHIHRMIAMIKRDIREHLVEEW